LNPGGRPRALVVDDEAPFRKVVTEILEQRRLEVRCAADIIEAMDVLRSWRPDILLLDVMMPGGSGLALLKRLRLDPKWRRLPIVIVSALAEKRDREAGIAAGANAYLTKPFSSSDLRRALSGYVRVLGTAELQAGDPS